MYRTVFWTLWERENVATLFPAAFGIVALLIFFPHILLLVQIYPENESKTICT